MKPGIIGVTNDAGAQIFAFNRLIRLSEAKTGSEEINAIGQANASATVRQAATIELLEIAGRFPIQPGAVCPSMAFAVTQRTSVPLLPTGKIVRDTRPSAAKRAALLK